MPISSIALNQLWQSARDLKSYHELLKFIDNLPNSESKERLRQSVEELVATKGPDVCQKRQQSDTLTLSPADIENLKMFHGYISEAEDHDGFVNEQNFAQTFR